jgi:hypothetical protein
MDAHSQKKMKETLDSFKQETSDLPVPDDSAGEYLD